MSAFALISGPLAHPFGEEAAAITKLDPLIVFLARAEARAQLVAAGLYTLQESVDTLWASAERDGLVDKFGADAVQWHLSDAFGAMEVA
jgi:hypothetical protein